MLTTYAAFFCCCCCCWFTFPLPHLSPPYTCGLPLAHSCVARSCFGDIISIMNNMEPTRLFFFFLSCLFLFRKAWGSKKKKKRTFPSSWLSFFFFLLIKCTYTCSAFMCLQAPVECKLYSLLFLLHAGALFFLFLFSCVLCGCAGLTRHCARTRLRRATRKKKKGKPDITVSCK